MLKKFNWEMSNNPEFWYKYEWGNERANYPEIVENRNIFIRDWGIDVNRNLHPRWMPAIYTAEMFNTNCNNATSCGEIFYLVDCDLMMTCISVKHHLVDKFLYNDWNRLPFEIVKNETTFYNISQEVYDDTRYYENDEI